MTLPHHDDALLEGVDELSARVFRAFMRTLRLHRQLMSRTMAEHGAHPGQAMCLHLLASNDGITQRDLAEALHLARPTVSKMLRGMEKAGLVGRQPDAADQRLTRVYLTPAGRDAGRQICGAVAAAHINETMAEPARAHRPSRSSRGCSKSWPPSIARVLDGAPRAPTRPLSRRRPRDPPASASACGRTGGRSSWS